MMVDAWGGHQDGAVVLRCDHLEFLPGTNWQSCAICSACQCEAQRGSLDASEGEELTEPLPPVRYQL
jgi:hypothetical protein